MTITMERPNDLTSANHTNADLTKPAAIAAATEIRAKRALKKADGHCDRATHASGAVSPTKTRGRAKRHPQPVDPAPTSGSPTLDGHYCSATHVHGAVETPIPDAAIPRTQPSYIAPHQEPYLTAADLPSYTPDPATAPIIREIVTLHRERQANIKAKTKLILQVTAMIRSSLCGAEDYEEDDSKADETTIHGDKRVKLTKAAKKRVDDAMKEAEAGEGPFAIMIAPHLGGIGLFEKRQKELEKPMVRLARQLPVYQWVKQIKGFGDVSFATIVGECGDIGSYKSVAAVWKRLGLAVINGHRQGNPGAGASADDWIAEGYNRSRRSVSWNARNGLIPPNGKWRPMMGDDLSGCTEYQRVFAKRARYESEKMDLPVTEAPTGKESYRKHPLWRASRYTEKRLIKHLFLAWRRA